VKALVRNAEVDGRRVDVRVRGTRVLAIADRLDPAVEERVWDAAGAALLPGLHDHHVHLHAMAAAAASVACGPPEVTDIETLTTALRAADSQLEPGAWLRGVGYHESVAGLLDRDDLDRLVPAPARPVRIQHRSGAMWTVNSTGLEVLERSAAQSSGTQDGFERESAGRLTGRIWRGDVALRGATDTPPDLAALGRALAAVGVTSVTDATPDLGAVALRSLRDATTSGRLPQRVVALGAPDTWAHPRVQRGPRKLLLHDHDLPSFDELREQIRTSHKAGRPVAVHCVSRVSLLLTLAALDATGHLRGDRIEHASVVPVEVIPQMAEHRLAVVTQPGFVAERGDSYLSAVDESDQECLYRYRTLVDGGVAVAPSSDAPYAAADPWQAIAAATARTTRSGVELGVRERVAAAEVLRGFLSLPMDPGGAVRRVTVGADADLLLLHVPLAEALRNPTRELVRAVFVGGVVVER
jgi:predicted amidohydrolase YtcJ